MTTHYYRLDMTCVNGKKMFCKGLVVLTKTQI